MSAASITAAMSKAGCTVEQIVSVLRELEEAKRAKGRASNARRQAEFRARRNESNGNNVSKSVTQNNESNAVTCVTGVTHFVDPSRARSLCEEEVSSKNKTSNDVLQKAGKLDRQPRARPRSKIPEGWGPDEAGTDFALSRGIGSLALHDQIQRFTDYHLSRGTLGADWSAAWRTWCGNFKTFNARPNARAGPASTKNGFHQVFDEITGGENVDCGNQNSGGSVGAIGRNAPNDRRVFGSD